MGACCSHSKSGGVAEPKLPVVVVAEGQPAKQTPRHPLYLKWEALDVPRFDADTEYWYKLGGRKLEPLLDHIDLVDLKFMVENIEAGLPMPRWQDVPRGARINRANIHRIQSPLTGWSTLAVLVLSYPWLDPGHPDSQLITMRRLLPCFKAFLSGPRNPKWSEWATAGLLVDFASLPQKSVEGHDDRCEEEKVRFKKGLGTINEWYVHECTTVLVHDSEMPNTSSGHTNLRPHSQRGWCSFELRASSIMKREFCLWSLRGFEDGGSPEGYFDARKAAFENVKRPTPMLPEQFGNLLRSGVAAGDLAFTASADLEVVSDQYGKAFHSAFAGVQDLSLAYLGWGDEELSALAAALLFAKKAGGLQQFWRLDVSSNPCTEAGLLPLAEALRDTDCRYFYAIDTKCSEAGKDAVRKALEWTKVTVVFNYS